MANKHYLIVAIILTFLITFTGAYENILKFDSSLVEAGIINGISMPDITGNPGEIVTIPIEIDTTLDLIEGFDVDIGFDSTRLVFQGVDKVGTLTENWSLVFANPVGNVLYVVGTSMPPVPISSGTTGVLLKMKFLVKENACEDPTFISSLTFDDLGALPMSGWEFKDGSFVCDDSLLGDVDGNGCVDILDVLCLYLKVIGDSSSCLNDVDISSCTSCDIDGNGSVDILDVLCLYLKVIGDASSCLDGVNLPSCN